MSVSARTIVPPERAPSTIFVGLDVHKESVTLAVLPTDAPAPVRVDKLPDDLKKLRRYLEKLGPADTLRTCCTPAAHLLRGVGCGVRPAARAGHLGHRVHGDRAVADPDQAWRPAQT